MPVLYVSRAEYKDRMGITGDERDFAVDRVLDSASRWTENVLGRRFYTTDTDETRYYTAQWYWQLDVLDDILSITSLTTDNNGDGVYETTWTNPTDYHLAPVNATVDGKPFTSIERNSWSGRFSFPAYEHAVRIVGRFGYCEIEDCPSGVRDLTMLAAEIDGQSLLDLNMPGVQNYKLGNELSVTLSGRNIPRFALTIVDQYKRGNRYVN